MGSYGFYVWGSYGITFLLLGGEVLTLLSRKRRVLRNAEPRPELETRNAKLETS